MSEQPNTPEWIAPLVRALMSRPPLEGTAGPLRCPVCECDHQQFKGIGIFHPTENGTKLVTIFPTASALATIDLPDDIKVGDTTLYTRYVCLCNGHHWAEIISWHNDHSHCWSIQVDDEGMPTGAPPLPPGSALQSPCEKKAQEDYEPLEETPPPPIKPLPKAPAPPSPLPSSPLLSIIANLIANPMLQSLTGGQLTPILVLPVPVPFILPPDFVPPQASQPEAKASVMPDSKSSAEAFRSAPAEAAVWWMSWTKKITAVKTETVFPPLPTTKGPHFYVANGNIKMVEQRRE